MRAPLWIVGLAVSFAPVAHGQEAEPEPAPVDAAPALAPPADEPPAPDVVDVEPTPAVEPPPAAAVEPAPLPVPAEAEGEAEGEADWGAFAAAPPRLFDARIYGYIDTNFETAVRVPERDGADVTYSDPDYGFDVLGLHAMVQGTIMERYRFFLNFAAPKSGDISEDVFLGVRNAWVEVPVIGDALQVRVGKTYRRFGLYNEILDATPTFIGIEPPELFDDDHLMLTRTTNLMVHGGWQPLEQAYVRWSLTTGNDERAGFAVPVGGDLRVQLFQMITLGSSAYWSGGDAGPTRGVGDGSPKGGVANWMASDHFGVFGGYAQLETHGLLVQAEGWVAPHQAVRDRDAVALLADANLNSAQRERFFVDGDPAKGVADVNVNYLVATAYGRVGYDFRIGEEMSVIPYGQLDWYSNPETVQQKSFGGDGDEAGLADDGVFYKLTAGAVVRPAPPIALKVDTSVHVMNVNGAVDYYPELRVSLSYLWELPSISMQ